MPIIPLVGVGIAAATGGFAAVGTLVGIGTLTLTSALTAVATIGSVLGAVGAITHDKTLSTVGMVMGGIGGIGALASSAGLLGAGASTDSLFGVDPVTSAAASGADAGAGAAFDASGMTADDLGFSSSAMGQAGIINSAASGGAAFNPGFEASGLGADELGYSSSAAGQSGSDFVNTFQKSVQGANPFPDGAADPLSTQAVAPLASKTVAPDADAAAGANPSVTGTVGGGTAGTGPSMPTSISTADSTWLQQQYPNPSAATVAVNKATGNSFTFDAATKSWQATPTAGGFMNFLKTAGGGTLGMGVLQAGGAFLQGSFDTLKPAQVAAYNAQAAANNAAADVTKQQAANMSSPIPVARRVPSAPVTGLINQPMGAAT